MSTPIIKAMLVGDDVAEALGITARGRSPVFSLCRALLAAGADPMARLECFRGEILCLIIKSVGVGATLTIEESATRGPRVTRWKPFSRADVAHRIQESDAGVVE